MRNICTKEVRTDIPVVEISVYRCGRPPVAQKGHHGPARVGLVRRGGAPGRGAEPARAALRAPVGVRHHALLDEPARVPRGGALNYRTIFQNVATKLSNFRWLVPSFIETDYCEYNYSFSSISA